MNPWQNRLLSRLPASPPARGVLPLPFCQLLALFIFLLILSSCAAPEQYTRPDQVMDFQALFNQNCAACHGADGKHGAAQPLNEATFQHFIPQEQIRKNITQGIPGTSMPGFSRPAGGFLTSKQIDVLVDGMQSNWGGTESSTKLPAYESAAGNPQKGEAAYNTYCAKCHGSAGNAGSVIDARFLQLVSNQSLRTTVVTRSPDHNWRSYAAGHEMTADEISDVVAWLASHRQKENQ
jgi:mono/diheme cytochrome c family protein